MGYKVTVEDIILDVPSIDRCWSFRILYACDHPVTIQTALRNVDKVIQIKKNDHQGSCVLRRCLRATAIHKLPG
ncbi:hypothetical protein GGR55DRAFT_666073 [Xylaria sp. FL0064]|nr:hypothetical protein GGR55DRAFT_666073 [Xylaria sp. FL0064]